MPGIPQKAPTDFHRTTAVAKKNTPSPSEKGIVLRDVKSNIRALVEAVQDLKVPNELKRLVAVPRVSVKDLQTIAKGPKGKAQQFAQTLLENIKKKNLKPFMEGASTLNLQYLASWVKNKDVITQDDLRKSAQADGGP